MWVGTYFYDLHINQILGLEQQLNKKWAMKEERNYRFLGDYEVFSFIKN